jgi:hypothetical protein
MSALSPEIGRVPREVRLARVEANGAPMRRRRPMARSNPFQTPPRRRHRYDYRVAHPARGVHRNLLPEFDATEADGNRIVAPPARIPEEAPFEFGTLRIAGAPGPFCMARVHAELRVRTDTTPTGPIHLLFD